MVDGFNHDSMHVVFNIVIIQQFYYVWIIIKMVQKKTLKMRIQETLHTTIATETATGN